MIVVWLAMLFSGASTAQSAVMPPADPTSRPAPGLVVIRSFTPEGLDPRVAEGQLVMLPPGTSSSDALVDLVTEFIPTYGQATNLVPANLGGRGMSSVLYQFRDQRSIVALVHADEPEHLAGPFGCRIVASAAAGSPEPSQFARIVHWCGHAVTLSNLDPDAIVRRRP